MPEKKESMLDTNETVNKDNANSCSNDFQGSPEEKKDVATDQHSGKKDGQKNTKIIKRIIKGVKKDKNDPLRFVDGVNFRGKLIGVEEVNDARGDRICQDSLQKLKAIVKSSGEHKQKVLLNISFQGIKISDEKTNEIIYQHPVHMISFTSLDVNDNRAFGYICGTTEEGHKFVGIKTEKAACQVVLTLQDLFQAVLEKKKQAMESAKQLQFSKNSNDDDEKKEMENNNKNKNVKSEQNTDEKENSESIYSDVISSSSVENVPPENNKSVSSLPKPQSNVDDLLCLQLEVDKLQENIEQMDSSMAAVSELNYPFMPDPFNTSTFVLYPQKDIYESTASTSSSEDQSVGSPFPDSKVNQKLEETSSFYVTYSDNDKYSVFSNIDTISSIFENSQSSLSTTNQDDEQINVSTSDSVSTQTNSQASPPKPPRLPQNDLFADLDPLVLKDLVDKTVSAFTSEPTKFYTSQSAPESTEEPIYGKINKIKKEE
ncbi:disabled homolog 2-like isoform X4 [Centruroides sculpturatus]|uniref:disabled homolog 2-like isoform X4 n=1 Tax=Centruroides sculpturatus TaxID=218467 RepID=UPI000C6D07F3|nr:disabled homolog 2-like isoform X4 [Centruroides sculpturatus]